MKTGVIRRGRAVARTAIKLSLCFVPLLGAACAMETGSAEEPTQNPQVAVGQVAAPGADNADRQPSMPGVHFSNPQPVPWKQPTGTLPGASTEDPGQPNPWHCSTGPCPPPPKPTDELVTNPVVQPSEVAP